MGTFDSQLFLPSQLPDDKEEDPFGNMFEDIPRESIFEKYTDEKEDNQSVYKKNMVHRGTFVGTPLYASPEMLDSSVSGPFTDLWALGVIVYQIINGEVPWKGTQEFGIF